MDEQHSSETDKAAEDPLDLVMMLLSRAQANPDASPRRHRFLQTMLDRINLITAGNGAQPALDPEHSELDATIAELRGISRTDDNSAYRTELLARLTQLVQQVLESDNSV